MAVAALVVSGCSEPDSSGELAFRLVAKGAGTASGPPRPDVSLAADRAAAARFAETLTTQDAQRALEADFTSRVLIAVFVGRKPARSTITVEHISLRERTLIVRVKQRSPSPEGYGLPAIVTPYEIVSVARGSLRPLPRRWELISAGGRSLGHGSL